ncbi:MAG: insulinase family protein [Planktomarina sp.]|uniref:M16 family metallopeptidase n=1 Tax=Planktomarina sp. TaxID=2024851 RepID=UPI003261623B|nr:insulinase family protein [Planktomarina sp.]
MRMVILGALLWAGAVQAETSVKTLTSPGGLSAWVLEEPAIPFTALNIMFSGGAALDPPDKRGAAFLMTGLLEEGAADLDSQAFAAAKEALSASFSFDVSDDTLSISVRVLTENRAEALALLKTALMQPRFDPDAIERVRQQVLSILASNAQDPTDIAQRVWAEQAFGDHAYGTSYQGTESSVAALTRADLLAAHQNLLVRDALSISAVGDITAEELGPILDDLLGDLPAGSALEPAPLELDIPAGLTVMDIPTPQSVAIFGHSGIDRAHPDFFAAFILNTILGGQGIESRLTAEVREKRGLTYGISTVLISKDRANVMLGQVASANDRIGAAIEVIRDEWRKLARDGVTAEELQTAQTYLTGAYPLRFDGNSQIARILVGMQRQGLGLDYIKTRNAKINAVTLPEINRVAAQLLKPEALNFVVAGQPIGLKEE